MYLTGGSAVADGRVMQAMLLDFYGDLLTAKQRECFDLHYNEDLSLSEIAEQSGISRQGVWDNIRRAQTALDEMEEKTGLVRRFSRIDGALERLSRQLEELCQCTDGQAQTLAQAALETVKSLDRG